MSVYYMNEGAFDLPDVAIEDRTTHVIEAKDQGHDLTLIVCRAPVPADKSLRQLAQARVLDEMARLAGYTVTEDQEAPWGGSPALEFTSRWRHEGKVIYQRQVHLAVDGTWMFFALSVALEGRLVADAWFGRMRESLRLRNGE